ncbi:MAG: protein-methionine-sulfoxide reductase heme-binding subunit MsrQ [Thermoleophilia bacterium]
MTSRRAPRRFPPILVRTAAHVGALLPGLLLAWDAATGGLSVDPVRDLTQRTGKDAFVLLVLSLAVGPVLRITGLRMVAPLARTFGLYAFGYAALHLLVFVGLDFGFRWDLIVDGVLEKRFALIGLTTFLILFTLAATSTRRWARRLGPLWKRIHRLVYVAGALATLHYLWAVKTITREQLIWAAVVGVLLALRLPEADRLFGLIRNKPAGERETQDDPAESMM